MNVDLKIFILMIRIKVYVGGLNCCILVSVSNFNKMVSRIFPCRLSLNLMDIFQVLFEF